MDGYSTHVYDGANQYVDHKTAETLSREVTKIITEQIGKSTPKESKSKSNKSSMK